MRSVVCVPSIRYCVGEYLTFLLISYLLKVRQWLVCFGAYVIKCMIARFQADLYRFDKAVDLYTCTLVYLYTCLLVHFVSVHLYTKNNVVKSTFWKLFSFM